MSIFMDILIIKQKTNKIKTMIRIRKLENRNGIWYPIREFTQVVNNPTAIANILIMLDDTRENEMLEITRIKD